MSSLKPKFLYQLAVSFLYSAASVIVFPYISRVLGPENIGKINFIDYTAQFFILFATFGIPLYGVREVAKVRHQPERLKQLTSELVSIHFITSVISTIFFILISFLNSKIFLEKHLMYLAAFNILFSTFSLDWFIQGSENFSFITKRAYLVKVFSVISIFLLVRSSNDYTNYYFILIATNIAILIIDFIYVRLTNFKFSLNLNLNRHFKPLFILFITSTAISMYTYMDTVVLGFISGTLAVGFYTTALKLIKLIQNFVNELSGVLLPRVSYLVETKNFTSANSILQKSLEYVLSTTIPLTLFLFVTAPHLIHIIAGKHFLPTAQTLQILSIFPLLNGLSNIFLFQILMPFNQEKKILTGVILAALISIGFNLLLSPFLQQNGAALTCVLAELFVTIFLGIHAFKYIKLKWAIGFISHIIISSLFFIPLSLFIPFITSNYIISFFVTALLCCCSFLVLQLFVFKNRVIIEAFEFLRELLLKIKPLARTN